MSERGMRIVLAVQRLSGDTAGMSERDNYADLRLPPPRTPSLKKIATIFLVVAVLIGLLVLGFDSVQTVVGNGCFDLTVELKGTGPAIVRVSGQAFMNKERADCAVEELKNDKSPWLIELVVEPNMYVIADPYDGKPLRIRLGTSEGGSPLRGYTSRQPEYLLIIAELSDGQRVFKLASIPNRKESRVLEVSVP
jgi:hypothetical protein